ncbi:CcdC protein domain-containing protein [Neobacillus cucumis]|uniref:CcdC protein domain-containing protein n=1 Tax=Neobacillus cucumis TaxID=1740721 RepID=UPI0019650A66|nr:CcdC protein domain-containing protein [Neobacillus cucumis]MBM7650962.1 preprotein translocase subunit YajC [Neobacillus cucumis]
MTQHLYSIVIIIAIVIFAIYRRVRRNIGWQELHSRKLIIRTCILFIIGLVFLSVGLMHPISLISDVVGILLGILLAYYGAGLTIFEKREKNLYYRPNIWIGSTVTIIFLARLIYRFYGMYTSGILTTTVSPEQVNGYQNISAAVGSSWSAGLLLIMFAYYIFYYLILLRKKKQLTQSEN